MKKLLKKKTQGFHTILISFFAILIFPCLLIIVFVQNVYIKQMDNYILRVSQNRLSTVVKELDLLLENMEGAANSIFMDNDFGAILVPSDFLGTRRISSKLDMLTLNQKYISDIFVYQSGNEYLFSSSGSCHKHIFCKLYQIADKSEEKFFEYLESEAFQNLDAINSGHPYKLFSRFSKTFRHSVSVIFVVDISKIEAIMQEQLSDGIGMSCIVDNEGNALSFVSNDGELKQEQYEKIINSAKDDCDIVSYGGTNYVVSRAVSEVSNYEFINVISGDSLSKQVEFQTRLWMALIALLLISGAVFVSCLSALIYKPIHEIKERAEKIYGRNGGKDEGVYDFINASMEYLEEKSLFLQEQVKNYRSYLIAKLLRGELRTAEERNLVYNMLDFGMYDGILYVTVISMNYSLSEEELVEYLQSCKMTNVSFVVKELEHGLRFVVIWNMSHTAVSSLNEQLEAILKTDSSIGKISSSEKCYDIEQVPMGFIRAAILDEMTGKQKGILWLDDEKEKQLPVAECRYIQEQIKAGNWRKAESYLNRLLELCREKELYWNQYVCMNLTYILSDVKEYIMNPVEKADILLLFKNREKNFYFIYLKELSDFFAKEANNHGEPESKSIPVIDKMKQYLAERYNDPNFSFQEMAEKYGMSLPALSKYFHEKSGIVINDYVTELKINRAKYLLENTDITAAEIGLEVGYYNAGSFSRRFRQITGQSPLEYRKNRK